MPPTAMSRHVNIPDSLKISRYKASPERGPKILFFSGGSALNGLSRALKRYTHNSIHLVTPFDSGGSSAKLRQAFSIPAMGDLRSRMMALADENTLGHIEVYKLFNYRLPNDTSQETLRQLLQHMAQGKHELLIEIIQPIRELICEHLNYFLELMPDSFDLRGASIGNLILASGYLGNDRQIEGITDLFSKLIHVQGTVSPTVNENLHLAAQLKNGRRIAGQHLITGKEVEPLESPISKLELVSELTNPQVISTTITEPNKQHISCADLICYPPGSFFSSIIANLLPNGVGDAISSNPAPKVYIPNLGEDPEQSGYSSNDLINTLIHYLQKNQCASQAADTFLNLILIDSKNGQYPGPFPAQNLEKMGIQVVDTKLISEKSAPYYDSELLAAALLSLT